MCVGQFGVGFGSEFVLCVGQIVVGFGGVSVCCVWDRLVWVCGSECVLCLVQFGVGLWEWLCAVCGTV